VASRNTRKTSSQSGQMMVFGDIALINQNQYMPPTNSSSKTAPNITRMANASNSGSSGSVSGSFGKLVRVLRIERAAPWRGDAAQLSKGRALTNPPSRAAQRGGWHFQECSLPQALDGCLIAFRHPLFGGDLGESNLTV
jgi:hypothetical protein